MKRAEKLMIDMTYEEFKTTHVELAHHGDDFGDAPSLKTWYDWSEFDGSDKDWLNTLKWVIDENFAYKREPDGHLSPGYHGIPAFLRLISLLEIYNPAPRAFTEEDKAFVRAQEMFEPESPHYIELFFQEYVKDNQITLPEVAAFVSMLGRPLPGVSVLLCEKEFHVNDYEVSKDIEHFRRTKHFIVMQSQMGHNLLVGKEKSYVFGAMHFPHCFEVETSFVVSFLQYWLRYIEEYEAGRNKETNERL